MIIKGGDRLSDIDLLRADPGLLTLLRMDSVPRPNTLSGLASRFSNSLRTFLALFKKTAGRSGLRINKFCLQAKMFANNFAYKQKLLTLPPDLI